jgi:release factor glutamine methyltransferase
MPGPSCRGPRPRRSSSARSSLAEDFERPRFLDVGVGSGAIALALKDERPDAQVTGVDVSADALALARENAERLGLEVGLRRGDGAAAAAEGWDIVVANPPYVDSLDDAQPELRWEPEVALLGRGEHERLARAADARFVVLEVGDGQAPEVARMLERLGYVDVAVTADLTGRDRVVEGRRS